MSITIHPTEFRADNPDMEGARPTAFIVRGILDGVEEGHRLETPSLRAALTFIADMEGVEAASIEARPVYRDIFDELNDESPIMWNVMDRTMTCVDDHGDVPDLACLGYNRCPGHLGASVPEVLG